MLRGGPGCFLCRGVSGEVAVDCFTPSSINGKCQESIRARFRFAFYSDSFSHNGGLGLSVEWSRLEWARGIGSATPRPPCLRRDVAMPRWTAAGSHLPTPTPGTMICADFNFVSTPCGRAKTSVHVPLLDCPPAGPRAQALLRGRAWAAQP